MTKKEFDNLKRGDIVRHKTGESYVIEHPLGGSYIAVRTIHVSNPFEWEKYNKENNAPAK